VGGSLKGKDGVGILTNLANEAFPSTNFAFFFDVILEIGVDLGHEFE